LNNKALSYLDLGKPEEAEKCWKEALAIDSSHADSLYNRSVHLWKNAKIDDLEAIRLLESGGKNYDCLLARLHLIRGDAETALEYLDKIAETSGETDEIKNLRAMAGKIIEERLVRTLGNRTSYETGLFDFNPDSNRVAIAYKVAEEAVDYIGWQIQLWDIVTGEMIASVHSSMKYPYSLKISPDGNKVLFIGRETEIEIWDIPEGNCIYTKDSCFICRTYVCFNSTGKMALWGDDRGISLWNVDTGTCIWEFKDNVNIKHYRVLCFSPDDSRALSCDYKTVHLWNIATGECIATLPCNASANAVAFAFSPDNNLVFIIGYDGTMQLWDIVTGTCARTRTSARKTYKHTFASNYFTGFDPENDRAIYEGKLWDTITGRCIRTYERAKTPFYFIPGGTKLIFHDMDGIKICRIPRITEDNGMIISQIHSTLEVTEQATLFDLLAGEIDRLVSNKDIATALIKLEELRNIRTFGSNEAYLAATRKLFPYCVSGKIREQYLKACVKTVSYLCFNPAGNQLIINQYTGDVSRSIFLDANTGQCVRTFDVKGHVIHFCFSPDGSKVLICSRGPYLVSSIHLWDTVTGEYIRTFPHNNNHIRTTFSPDGHKIVSESGSYRHYSVDVWDVADKKRLYTFRSNALHGSIVQLSPCGTKAIIKGSKLIDVSTGKCIGKLVLCPDKKLKMISDPEELKNIPDTEFNASFVGRHRFSPDGNRILIEYCIRSELEMKLWDIKAMKYVQTFHVPYNNFYTSHFSPDGSKILGVTDQKLWLWDTHTGECLCSIDHQTESHNKSTKDYYINSFSLTLDNSKVLLTKHKSLYEGYQLSLWDIRTGECLLTRENVTKDCGLSPDGKTLVFTSGDNLYLYELEYELHFPGQEHRDEDAQASKRIKAKIEEIIMKDLVITMKNGFPEQK
ncbi:MAG: tetratricopeptide repeat protein, partial [Tannerellaceae bacterium]|jgi:WD40 repeat protein|nr:tetratricopeptide repeat protein [Tannerellaceae bacterium]